MSLFRIVLLTVFLTGCGKGMQDADPLGTVNALRTQERFDEALVVLKTAMRSNAGDPDLRLAMANIYLDMGDGSLALVALDQAVDRGASEDDLLLPRARALFSTGDFADVIDLAVPQTIKADDRYEVQLLKADSSDELSASSDGSDYAVTAMYLETFGELGSSDTLSDKMSARLDETRKNRVAAERAWQHFSCANVQSARIEWHPIDIESRPVLRVGKGREIESIAAAALVASDGDVVEIDAGTYVGDVTHWPQNDLIVRGVGGRPIITANGKSINSRDIWYFSGNNIVVENIEMSGARSKFENGAAVRHTGIGLTLRHVYLHDNENGVLTGNNHPDENSILIEFSEFADNGDGRGFAHNIYIGRSASFTMRFSYSHSVDVGHLVKSRAKSNRISYNRLTDNQDGKSSYIVDIPEGGSTHLIGNMIERGAAPQNHGMISFAGEDLKHAQNHLSVVSNTFYNRDFEAVVVRNHKNLTVEVVNNLFAGAGVAVADGPADMIGNQILAEHGLLDPDAYDYRLAASATAIDRGKDHALEAEFEYQHPVSGQVRRKVWQTDIGALERCGL